MVDWRRQAVLCVVAGRMGSQFGSWMANPTSTKQLCTPWSSSTPRAFTCLANRPSACRLARCALICPADQAPFGATAAAGSGCPGPVLLNLPIAGSPKRRAEQPFSRCTYIRLGTCGRAPYEGLLLAADSTSWFLCAPLRACVARRARPAGPGGSWRQRHDVGGREATGRLEECAPGSLISPALSRIQPGRKEPCWAAGQRSTLGGNRKRQGVTRPALLPRGARVAPKNTAGACPLGGGCRPRWPRWP